MLARVFMLQHKMSMFNMEKNEGKGVDVVDFDLGKTFGVIFHSIFVDKLRKRVLDR